MKQKYLDNLSNSSYGDIAEAVFNAVGPLYEEKLKEYRSLKQLRFNIINEIKSNENKLESINTNISEMQKMLGRVKIYFISVLVFIAAFLMLSVLIHSLLFMAVALIVGAGALYYIYNMRRSIMSNLSNSEGEALRIKLNISKLKEELNNIESRISSFKLPDMRIRVYRVYVPIGLVKFKSPTGSNYTLGILPVLKNGTSLKLAVIENPEDINNAIREVKLYDDYYRDTLIKEKTEGIKIIDELRKINLWEEVYKARSPESLLIRSLYRLENAVKMIHYEELKLPLVMPLDENVEFIKKSINSSIDGHPQNTDKESEKVLSDSLSKLEDLYNAISELLHIKGAVIEAQYMANAYSNYRDLSERIYELVIQSIPIDSFSSFAESIYCKKCVEQSLGEYVRRVDLKRWIEVNILGGVSEDPEIVNLPPRLKKDKDINGLLDSINRLFMEKVPLPGLEDVKSGSLEDLEKMYRESIIKYALIISGADSYIKYALTSPFEEPKIICEVCSEGIKAEDLYHISNLALPYIKGYIAVMYELQDNLFKKSESIRLSVNQSRLSKDQRKSMLSIDETMLNDIIIKIRDVEYNIKSNIEYIKEIEGLLSNSEIGNLIQGYGIYNIISKSIKDLNVQEQVIEDE